MTKETAVSAAEMTQAATEYFVNYRAYESKTAMNVSTPEGAGVFCGAWRCDEGRLLRALCLAIEGRHGVCSVAAKKVAGGEAPVIGTCGYGADVGSGADVYRTPNGGYRDPDGRYLTAVEADILERVRCSAHDAHYYRAGPMTQRFIEECAGDQIARTLSKGYLTGFPICTDRQKLDAYRRVAAIYRDLAAAYAAAG